MKQSRERVAVTGQREEKRQLNRTGIGQSKTVRLLLPCIFALAAALLLGRIFPYYYDLNDDALMAQILAGSYTGEPELRNIQSYFPLTAALGGLYRANRAVDWYGLFLLSCQFGCLALVLGRVMACRKDVRAAVLAALAAAGLLLYHMVFLQYSVTVGMMGAAAAFWLLTLQPGETKRAWRKELLPPVLLIALGYLLRSEMMLFVGPFAALAFLIRAAQLKMKKGKKLRLMCTVLVLVLLSLFAGEAGNRIGYRSDEWRTFYRFFDARTQLYDFQRIPEYEGNEEFYQSIGLGASEAELIRNYNFGLDADIDAEKLEAIAAYAKEKAAGEKSTGTRWREALWDYRASQTTRAEEPYRMISLVLYVSAVLLSGAEILRYFCRRSGSFREKGKKEKERCRESAVRLSGVLVLYVLRSALLLYLYYHHRPVVRLTHSIFLAEAVILLWLIGEEVRDRRKEAAGTYVLLTVLFLAAAAWQVRSAACEQEARLSKNAPYEAFLSYCREHPENVYFTDVYSTVDFSDRLFEVGDEPSNYTLMGGWAARSPLEAEKLRNLGLFTQSDSSEGQGLDEILLGNANVFVATEADADPGWLLAYYSEKGMQAELKEEDRIGNDWIIYSVKPETEDGH